MYNTTNYQILDYCIFHRYGLLWFATTRNQELFEVQEIDNTLYASFKVIVVCKLDESIINEDEQQFICKINKVTAFICFQVHDRKPKMILA